MPGMHQNQIFNHSQFNKGYILNGCYWNGSCSLHIERIFHFVEGKKLLCQSCISQTPTPKAYNWKWINIWSEVVMQGEDFGSMKEAVDMSQMISTLL